ncbi:cytochrome d ubiquinol oxidase subunit II [bacterium]|nr:cytochrome d ubiquinol oxidase subunit II [bacterium]
MLANVILAIIWLGVSAYGVFGGADFGAGMWDLAAGGPERGAGVRRLIERVIGPVWEANHVWLIFVLVYLWTAFPEPFASIASTLWIPLTLAALGIIFRGSGFAFRKWAVTLRVARAYGIAFAGASVVTPFFLGAIAGAVASGRVPAGNAAGDPWTSWINPTSVLGGLLAMVACAFLAAVLMTREADAVGNTPMVEYFRARAMAAGATGGLLAFAGIFVLRADAPDLFDGLTSPGGVIALAGSAIGGLAALALVHQRHFVTARGAAVIATVAVLWGWGIGQYPDVLPGAVTIEGSAASSVVLWSLLGAFLLAGLIAVPALVYLYTLTEGGSLEDGGSTSANSSQALLKRLEERSADG